jgi:hypothetical protein
MKKQYLIFGTIIIMVFTICKAQTIQWQSTGLNAGINPVNPIIYSNNIIYGIAYFAGIYQSSNFGGTWTPINNGITIQKGVSSLTKLGNTLFASCANGGGIFVSNNGGSNWTLSNNGLTSNTVRALITSSNNIFAGTDLGVHVSSNNGVSWTSMNNGINQSYINVFAVSGTSVFAGSGSGGLFVTSNNASSWSRIDNGGLQNKFISSLLVHGSQLFAGTNGSGVYLSNNNGQTWSSVGYNINNFYITSLASYNSLIFSGRSNNGVHYSTDNGNTWNPINNGLSNMSIKSLSVIGSDLYAGDSNGEIWKLSLTNLVGIEEYDFSNNYTISPNPFSDEISIKCQNLLFNEDYFIYNSIGELILKGKVNSLNTIIDTDNLTQGIYFIHISKANRKKTFKIIKL